LANLGALLSERGEYQQAEAYLQEALTLARKLGHHTPFIPSKRSHRNSTFRQRELQ